MRTLSEIQQRYREIEYKVLGNMEKIALRELMELLSKKELDGTVSRKD